MVVSDNPFRAKVPIYLFVFQYYVVNAGKYWKTLNETEDLAGNGYIQGKISFAFPKFTFFTGS